MESPWNLPGVTKHRWHCKFSVSGTIAMNAADAEATALDLWGPIRRFTEPHTSLVEWAYYQSGHTSADLTGSYAAGTHAGDRSNYTTGTGHQQQLEVCILARCPVGKNTRGKQVYLRKWIHDVESDIADANAIMSNTGSPACLLEWIHGAGPHDVVPVDPTDGTQGGPWTVETHLYTHQLRRGPRRRKAAAGSIVSDALKLAEDLATLKGLSDAIKTVA